MFSINSGIFLLLAASATWLQVDDSIVSESKKLHKRNKIST